MAIRPNLRSKKQKLNVDRLAENKKKLLPDYFRCFPSRAAADAMQMPNVFKGKHETREDTWTYYF